MAFAPRRRRRRSRWVLTGVLLSVLALFVNAGLSSSSKGPAKRLAGLAYVDEVRPHVEASTTQGADLAKVRDDAAGLGREGLRRMTERVRRGAAAQLLAVRGIDVPEDLAADHSLLLATMVLRARATSLIAKATDLAAGSGAAGSAVDDLVKAGGDLVAADHTYRTFVEVLAVEGADGPLLPESRWVADPAVWERAEVYAFVSALRSGSVSTPVHDVALLTLATEPKPVASEAGSAVLPPVKTLRIEVVVANIGNAGETRVPLVATLTGPAGEVDTARDFVDLAAGQRRAVALGGLRLAPGGPLTLTVVVGPVDGEEGREDNQRSMSLVVRG